MELNEIKKLIEMLKDTDVTELSLEKEGTKFKIKKESYLRPAAAAQPVLQQPVVHAAAPAAVPEKPSAPAEAEQKLVPVTSPIVGFFYTSSSPESPPFVTVGSKVEKGQVLCIVEAMKLMNEIECDTNGIIKKILPENGQSVEYGETLFLIEPLS